MSINDNLTLDISELQLKWAVEDVNRSAEKLIAILEKYGDYDTIEVLNEYLSGIANYVTLADNIRKDLA